MLQIYVGWGDIPTVKLPRKTHWEGRSIQKYIKKTERQDIRAEQDLASRFEAQLKTKDFGGFPATFLVTSHSGEIAVPEMAYLTRKGYGNFHAIETVSQVTEINAGLEADLGSRAPGKLKLYVTGRSSPPAKRAIDEALIDQIMSIAARVILQHSGQEVPEELCPSDQP
jgi:hypothetical protein